MVRAGAILAPACASALPDSGIRKLVPLLSLHRDAIHSFKLTIDCQGSTLHTL
jgi:hypothetical protein